MAAAIGKTGAPALQELTYAQRGKLFAQVPDTLAANRRKYEQIAIANSGNTRTDAAIDIDGEAKTFDPAAVDACLAAAPGYTMGFDAAVRAQSIADTIAFLQRSLRR